MKKFSIFLYLKQGIRGVLKFRIQFFVIIILSFLSTFILSISLSSTKRMSENYDNVMQKMDKFDYISTREVGVRNNTDSNYVPLNDFVNFQFLTSYNSAIDPLSRENVSLQYNFNLIDTTSANLNFDQVEDQQIKDDYNFTYQSTFITKAFAKTEIQKAFFDFLSNESKNSSGKGYLDGLFDYDYNPITGEINYKNSQDLYSMLLGDSYNCIVDNCRNNSYIDFLLLFIEELKDQLLVDLKSEDSTYLKNSIVYKLWENGTISEKDFEAAPKDIDVLTSFSFYIYFSFMSLVAQMLDLTTSYVHYYTDQAVSLAPQQSNNSIKDYFNKNISEAAGFNWYDGTSTTATNIANTLFAYLTGANYEGNTTTKTSILIDQSESRLPWIQRVDLNHTGYEQSMINQSNESIYDNGLRGSLVQITGQVNSDTTVSPALGYTNQVYKLKIQSGNTTTNENLASYREFRWFDDRFDINYWSPLDIKMYYLRTNLISEALDIKVDNRAEILFSDSVAEIKYRLVVLDNYTWPDRLTLLSGRKPVASNEVVINPQYAKKNNIKLGQSVQLGGGTFIISGFATDPLSNYPVASSTDTFPNVKKTPIVYGNSKTLEAVLTTDFQKFASKILYTIVTMENDQQNAEEKMAYFYSSLAFNETDLYSSYQTIDAINKNETVSFQNSTSGEQYETFDDSVYSQNWKLTPLMIKYFRITSYCLSVLISLIALAAIIIAIKKTIHLNSGEIGILKAMGVSSAKISISYISYSFITMLIVVPLAWLTASFAQELLVSLFLNYSGGLYNVVIFDWKSLLISGFLFGLVSMIVAYIVAFFLTSRNVLEILTKVEKHKEYKGINRFKQRITKNMKFSSKLSTELAFSGFSKTILTGTTILVASFLMGAFLAVPGVVSQTLSSYYKNIKYNNQVENIELIGNAPLAKTSLSPWQGVEEYEDTYIDSNGVFGAGINEISKTVSSSSSINDSSVLPKILMSEQGEYKWFYDLFLNDKIYENNALSVLSSIFGTNFLQLVGKEFSLIEAQQLLEYIIHSNKFGTNSSERIGEVNKFSDILTNGLPELLSMIIPGSSGNNEGNWKEQITDIILGQAPAYIKNYLSISENRMNHYKFGYSFNTYIPNVDTMYTSLNATSNNDSEMNLIGLLETQNAFVLPRNQDQLFITNENLEKLENLIYGRNPDQEDIFIGNFKLYDANKKTLTIPTITNGEFNLTHSFTDNLISDINFKTTRMLLSEGDIDIPNSAWKYDDGDYQKVIVNQNQATVDQETRWLDPEDLQSSKFTYQAIFKDSKVGAKPDLGYVDGIDRYLNFDSLRDNSYAFYDFVEDENGNLKPIIRPYYQYDNVVLFVPTKVSQNINAIAGMGNKDKTAWIGNASKSEVPQDTVADWEKKMGESISDFTWIRPYSYYYDASATYTKPNFNLSGAEINEMINAKENFLAKSFKTTVNPFKLSEQTFNWSNMSNGNVEKINLQRVDTINVYGKELAIVDQNIANLVKGYSTAKYIPFNFTYEKLDSQTTVDVNGTKINTFDYYKPEDMLSEERKDEWIYGKNKTQQSHIPSVWYNGVFSNEKEPYFITTQASFARSPKIGEDTISTPTPNFYSLVEIKNMNFLSEQQNLINELTNLILTIAIFFICFIVFVSTLSIILISDIYVQQYKKFMITMKSLGYSNWRIIKYSFGFVSIFSSFTFILGTTLSQLAIIAIASYINSHYMAIPFGITWWLPLISSFLIIGSYVCSIIITTSKIRKESPSTLVV